MNQYVRRQRLELKQGDHVVIHAVGLSGRTGVLERRSRPKTTRSWDVQLDVFDALVTATGRVSVPEDSLEKIEG